MKNHFSDKLLSSVKVPNKVLSKEPSGFSLGTFQSCYTKHPALPIGQYLVYGGNCRTPSVLDADVYVGLDSSFVSHSSLLPWTPAVGVSFQIQDMSVPADIDQYKKLIEWLVSQIVAGKKVHIGCIGGHGRTGLVLSTLVKVMTGEEDAITYVRAHYCPKAVETSGQIEWLNKHFGIKIIAASKVFSPASHNTNSSNTINPIISKLCIWGMPLKLTK